jgi:hypothetical protein
MSESARARTGLWWTRLSPTFQKKKRGETHDSISRLPVCSFFCLYGGEVKSLFFVPFVYEQYSPLLTFRFLDCMIFYSIHIPLATTGLKPKIIKRRRRAGWQRWPQSVPRKEREVSPAHNSPSHENSNTSSQKHWHFFSIPKANFYIPLFCFSTRKLMASVN